MATDQSIETQTIVRSSAGGKPPTLPAGAARSVFDMARAPGAAPAKPAPQKRKYTVLDLAQVHIKSGVPLPPAAKSSTASAFATLLERMKPGEMVELTPSQGKSLRNHAQHAKVKVAVRNLDNGQVGVWRL